MNDEKFQDLVIEQLEACVDLLSIKGDQYAASEDRLHNFNRAAELEGISVRQALAGMMAKHTVSIYDMCHYSHITYPDEVWDEKIHDHINYLLLLRAIIEDEKNQ